MTNHTNYPNEPYSVLSTYTKELSKLFQQLSSDLIAIQRKYKHSPDSEKPSQSLDYLLDEMDHLESEILNNEKLLKFMIREQDTERKTLSYELYHVIGQTIYSLLISIRMILKLNLDDAIREHFMELKDATNDTLNKIRELSFDLFPLMVEDLGLITTLRSYIENLQSNYDTTIHFHYKESGTRAGVNIETCLYRVSHDILDYLVKIRQTHDVSVQLVEDDQEISMIFISKNLKPVPKSHIFEHLLLAKKRIEQQSGMLKFSSTPDHQTLNIKIVIPQS